MKKNQYKKRIWKQSLINTKKEFSNRAELMKFVIASLLIIAAILLLSIIGIHFVSGSAPFILWQILGGDIVLTTASWLSIYIISFLNMWKVAEEEHDYLEKNLQKFENPEKLMVRQTTFRVDRNNFFRYIENYSNRKIIDAEAHIQTVHMITSKHEGHEAVFSKSLVTVNKKNILMESEIRPGNGLELLLASAIFDKNRVVFAFGNLIFDEVENAIFKVFINVSGKYEGDNEYKKNLIDTEIEVDMRENFISLNGMREFAEKLEKEFSLGKEK